MVYYYKVMNLKGETIGIVNSYALRCYNERNNRILCCNESLAQYICVNDSLYRVAMFSNEHPLMKGKYPEAYVDLVTEEEYQKYRELIDAEEPE